MARARPLAPAFSLVACAFGVALGCGLRSPPPVVRAPPPRSSEGPPLIACPPPPRPSEAPGLVQRVADAGLTFVRCDEYGNDGAYGLLTPGQRDATVEEMSAWGARVAGELMALEGVMSVVFDSCCSVDGRQFASGGCLGVALDGGTPADARLPAALARSAAASFSAGVRARVSVTPRVPRCSPPDPACGPLRYGLSCVDAGRTALRRRRFVQNGNAGRPNDSCAHDGECQACGGTCVSYRAGPIDCPDEYAFELRDASCGCVRGQCAWFEFDD